MKSGVNTSTTPNRAKAVQQLAKVDKVQQINRAASTNVVRGSADPDSRKLLAKQLSGMEMVHRQEGTMVTSSLAVSTNSKSWRNFQPGHGEGLFVQPGFERSSKPYYYTDLVALRDDPDTIVTGPDFTDENFVALPGSRTGITHPAAASAIQSHILQDRDG
jgi:hypothetical protein